MFGLSLIGLVLFFLFLFYVWRQLNFWKKFNIPYEISSSFNRFIQPIHLADLQTYKKYGDVVGIYAGLRPELLIGDPNLVKLILGKKFQYFPNRRFVSGETYFLGSKGMFVLNFESWRRVRAITSPAFTSGKLKQIFPLLYQCTDYLVNNLEKATHFEQGVNVKNIFTYFSIDVIASCAFGANIDSQNNIKHPLVNYALNFFGTGFSLTRFIAFLYPKMISFKLVAFMSQVFKISAFDFNAQIYLGNMIKEILKLRDANKELIRNDFIQLLADARLDENTMIEKDEKIFDNDTSYLKQGYTKKLDIQEIVDQGMTFFIAGFDTTSNALSSLARLLALNENVQKKLIDEIDSTFNFGQIEIEYNVLMEMKYLDAVIKEGLRLCTPLSRIERRCEVETDLDGYKIPKDTIITIPVMSMHLDERNFDQPEKFLPERFLEGSDLHCNLDAYLPFADGPRNCIGKRFALLEMKLAVVRILQKYQFCLNQRSTKPLEYYNGQLVITPKEIVLTIKKRLTV